MKRIYFFLLVMFVGLFSTSINLHATDNSVALGGEANKKQLRINVNNDGTYCVYRCADGVDYDRQFYSHKSHLFAIKIGNTTFSSGGTVISPSKLLDKITLTAFDKIEDVGTAVDSGVQQEVTKRFTGTYSGKTFSVTLRIMYNTSSPDYFVKQATIDLRNIPGGTPVIYAYGWDTYVNGNDFGYAYLVPNISRLNNNSTETNLHLTTAQVQSLRMVGARNGTGAGSLIGFFPIGRPFDRAYSASPYYNGSCFNMPALTPGNGLKTTTPNTSQYRMQFGAYNYNSSSNNCDNSAGVGYDHIPAGEITEIKTGFTFTNALDGELNYLWNNSKNHKAKIGDDVFLKLDYSSYNNAALNNIGFHVDFVGLPIRSACSSTGFTGGTPTGVIGNEFYELKGASIVALGKASVTIPVRVTRAGQWTVDGSSISSTTQALPLGMPAKLTVSTTVSLSNAENVNVPQNSSKEITVKFPDGVTAAGDVTVNLNYSGAISSFSSLPASVTIPAGQNSAKFTVTASPAGTNQAEVNVTLKGTNQEYVTVASPSQVKLITLSLDKIGFTINDKNYKEWDGKAFCDATNQLTLTAKPASLDGSLITWEVKIDGVVTNYAGKTATVQPLPNPAIITVIMKFAGSPSSATFSVGKTATLWTPENNTGSDKMNWNNPKNWTPQIVPSSCNTVYLQGESSHYPQLTENSRGACDSIFFIQGAELGRPDLLKYNRAFVQFNFGLVDKKQITDKNDTDYILNQHGNQTTSNRMLYSASTSKPLDRERWYMFSSPLRGVVTGDIGFGGFPLTILRKFNPAEIDKENYTIGQWTIPYRSMTEPLNATEGFTFYMFGIPGDAEGSLESGLFKDRNDLDYLPKTWKGKNYGIKETNGILELPFFEDTTNLYAHRTQVYNPASRQSVFFTINDGKGGMNKYNDFLGTSVSYIREANDGNYRFIADSLGADNQWVFRPVIYHSSAGLKGDYDFLAGNPYMSSIDIIKFLEDNAGTVQSSFKLWNGEDFFSYALSNGQLISVYPTTTPIRYIAPMQSFVLTTLSDYAGNKEVVKFDVAKISTARPSGEHALRSSNTEENILRVKAENEWTASYMLVGYKENAFNGYNENEDVKKLFSPFDYAPQIYPLAGEIPVDINFINNDGEITVPMGVKTGYVGEIKLTFTGMDNYFKTSSIEFIDAKENRTVDLTGKANFIYTFNNEKTGIQNGRFSLRFGKSLTAMPEINNSDDLKVYGDSKGIYVITSSSDPVQQLTVYDFQGRKLYESRTNANYYPLQENYGHSPVIVKVATANRVKTVKIK